MRQYRIRPQINSYRAYSIIFWSAPLYSSLLNFFPNRDITKKEPYQLAREETETFTADLVTHTFELASVGTFKITLGL